MISLDQVLLLEQKIESAVAKIQQLQAENDALNRRCLELTNALSDKSEQLTTIETDQNQIESGILKALDRLNSIENSVLKAAGQVSSTHQTAPAVNTVKSITPQPVVQQKVVQPQVTPAQNTNIQQTVVQQPVNTQINNAQNIQQQKAAEYNQILESSPIVQHNTFKPAEVSFDSLQNAPSPVPPAEPASDNLGFDIF